MLRRECFGGERRASFHLTAAKDGLDFPRMARSSGHEEQTELTPLESRPYNGLFLGGKLRSAVMRGFVVEVAPGVFPSGRRTGAGHRLELQVGETCLLIGNFSNNGAKS